MNIQKSAAPASSAEPKRFSSSYSPAEVTIKKHKQAVWCMSQSVAEGH